MADNIDNNVQEATDTAAVAPEESVQAAPEITLGYLKQELLKRRRKMLKKMKKGKK
ncbi:MAG: hypothetical protein ACNI27_09005 [Desulfovibrio sp.]